MASTYIGGNNDDAVTSLAINSAGDVYLAGYIFHSGNPYAWPVSYPTTDGAYDASYNGGFYDSFISKLDASLGSLLASTFIGGGETDWITSLAIDGAGNVCVAGSTGSADYPITAGAFDMSIDSVDGFVTKLDAGLSAILSSTFIGGSDTDEITSIAIDDNENIYIIGSTGSTNYPTTNGAYDRSYNLYGDGFVSKLDTGLHNLLASTFIGGRDGESITSLAIDGAGNVYLAGNTMSADYPVTTGAYDTTYNGGFFGGGFVSKLDARLSALLASTFICGSEWDVATSLAIDNKGNVYVVGYTWSADYPTTDGAFDTSHNGLEDGFITKLNATLSTLLSSSFLGGNDYDQVTSIAIDNAENVYVAGSTRSIDYPTTNGAYDMTFNGAYIGSTNNAYISKFSGDIPVDGDNSTLGIRPYCLYGKGSVNLSTGNFILAQTDLNIPSVGPSLEFTRFYNSQDDYIGLQGKGWTNNFNLHLTVNQDGSVSVAYGDGHVYTFTYDGASYVRPAGCFETLTAGPGSGYTLTFKDQTGYIFNDIGQLTSITDQNNNTLTLTYTVGLLTLASEPTGRTLSFNYDTNNRLTGVTDSAGRTVIYTYDNEGNLATVQDVLGNNTSYHYNTQDLTEIIAPDGNTLLSNIYDSGKVTYQTDGSDNTTQFSYDPDNHLTTIKTALGNTITTTYDEQYRSTSITYPGNITETFSHDANNCCASITDPLNHITSYTYDGNGNLLTVTDPASHTTTMEYDDNNNLLSVENALEKQSTFTYDSNGNLIKTTDSLGNETIYNYDESGLLLSTTSPDTGIGSGTTIYTYQNGLMQTVTDPAENTTTYSYDATGRPISITDNAGKTSAMTYDNAGNLLTVADPLGNTTSYTYDWRGNILTKTDAGGNTTSYTYNNNGLLVSKIDALNNETGYEYDAENRLVKVTDPRGNTTQLSYDALGRLAGVTNPLGITITNQYDAAGNLTGRIDALGNQVLTVTYDELYNPKNMTDALGNNVSFDEYDELSRLTRFTDPGGNTTQFEYDDLSRLNSTIDAAYGRGCQEFDARGNRTAMVDPNNNQTSFNYDNADRLTVRTTAASGNITLTYNNRNLPAQKINARGQITNYEYDDAGRLVSATYPDGTVSYTYDQNGNLLTAIDSTGTIEYQYDALNRLVKYEDTRGNTIEYAYDAAGNLRILTYPRGRQVEYQYDVADRLIQVTDWAGRITAYEYDPNGRLVKTVNSNGTLTTRTYDEAGRLSQLKDVDTGGSVISQYDYTYDVAGNLIQEENFNETVPFTMDDAALTYATDNRLSTYNGQTVLYDADGNMTAGPLAGEMAGFTYDAGGRLTGAGNTTYTYDAGNNRISVAGAVNQKSFVVNPNASLSQVLIQTNEQNHQTFYIYGLGLIGQEDEGGVYRSYHFDHRGSAIALTDESGNITDRFQYAPYGELVYRSGNTATPFLYVGRYGVMTDESDLYYMRARYYNPVAKRFLSPDTLIGQVTNPQSQNRYMYCEGNPVNYIDPTGYVWIRAQYFMSELAGLHYDDLYDVYKNLEEDISYDGWSQSDLEDLSLQFRIANELLIIRGDPVYYDQDEKDEAKITLAGIMDEENEKEEQKLLLASILVMGRTIGYEVAGKAGSKVPSQLLRGKDFEGIVLQEQAIPKNLTKIGNSIPDSLINGRIIEVKDANYIYKNKQFRDYINSGKPIDLIVSPRTRISKPLQDAIRNSGGSIRVRQADGTYSIY